MLERHVILTGVLHCKSGLRIGGSKDDMEIGGNDNPIIRHPVSGEPYVPGSSLKGKIRSLLEIKLGKIGDRGTPHNCGTCEICRGFGAFRSSSLTRFVFRDAPLTESSREQLLGFQEEKGVNMSELKREVGIDRRTGKANSFGPRTTERVPAGTEFAFEVSVRLLEGDSEQELMGLLRQGIELLESDYLGGSGSRGYGHVEFRNLKIDDKPFR